MRATMFFLTSDFGSFTDVRAVDGLFVNMPTRLYGSFDEAWREGASMGHDPIRVGMVRVDKVAHEMAEIVQVTSEEELLELEVDIARSVVEQYDRKRAHEQAADALRSEQLDYRLSDINEERMADDAVDAVAHTTILHSSQRDALLQEMNETAARLNAQEVRPGPVRWTGQSMARDWGVSIDAGRITDAQLRTVPGLVSIDAGRGGAAQTRTVPGHEYHASTVSSSSVSTLMRGSMSEYFNQYVTVPLQPPPQLPPQPPQPPPQRPGGEWILLDPTYPIEWRVEDDGMLSSRQMTAALNMMQTRTTSCTAPDHTNQLQTMQLIGSRTDRNHNTGRTYVYVTVTVGGAPRNFVLSRD